MYERARKLHAEGLSIYTIAGRLRKEYGSSVAAGSVSRWLYHGVKPDTRAHLPALYPSPQLSYFIGAYKGDGYHWTNSKKRMFRVGFRVKDKDFAVHASEAISFVLRRPPVPLWSAKGRGGPLDRFHVFTVESWALGSFLELRLGKLLAVALCYPREFLRGIFDAEGFVTVTRLDGRLAVHVGLGMSNRRIVEAVLVTLLRRFGIRAVGPYHRKAVPRVIQGRLANFSRDFYEIRVERFSDIQTFADLVGFSIQRKQEKLEAAVRLIRTRGSRNALAAWESRRMSNQDTLSSGSSEAERRIELVGRQALDQYHGELGEG